MVDDSHNDRLTRSPNTRCLINGVGTDFVSVYDRSVQYGDGVFETLLCIKGKPVFWERHMQRLLNAIDRLDISCPDISAIRNDIDELVRVHEHYRTSCVIKVIVTRGTGRRGYQYPADQPSRRIVTIDAIDRRYSSILSAKLLHGDVRYCRTPVSTNTALAGIKHLNRLDNVLARNELKGDEYIDGVMLDDRNHVIECAASNLFLVNQGVLMTPDLSTSGVAGIVRDIVLQLAGQLGIKTVVGDITQETVDESSEMFITNSLIGIKSIDRLENKVFHQQATTQRIFDSLIDCISW